MAEIKTIRKGKEKSQLTYTEKIHRHRLSFVYRLILVLVVVGALGAVFYIQYRNQKYEEYDTVSSKKIAEAQGTWALQLGDHALVYSKDGAHCMDTEGKVLWNQTFQMQDPMVEVCGNVTAIADYNGRKIYVYSASEKLGEIDTTLPIRSVSVSQVGVVAAVLEDGDVTWIRAFSADGEMLVEFKTSMENYGYPFAVSLSPNSILCAVSYMYMDMGQMKSSLGFYNFGEVGKNEVDNFVGGFDHADTVVPYVQFMNNNTAFAVGDDRLVFYQGNQKPANAANILFSEELQGVYYNEEYVGLVFMSTTGGGKRLDVYDSAGNKVTTQIFDMDQADIVFDKNTYIIYNEAQLYIGTMDGKEKFDGTFEKTIKLLVTTGSPYRYTVVTEDTVDVIRMR